jgi:hypothetical protein
VASRGGGTRTGDHLTRLPFRAGVLARRALLLAAPALLAGPGRAQEFPSHFRLPAPAHPGLVPLGGMLLDTSLWGFGGFSGLHLAPDLTLSAVSDRGRWWQARLRLDADGQPRALEEVRHGPLRGANGQALGGRAGDAEALVRLASGNWLIGFERQHRIQRHASLEGPGLPFPAPPGLGRAPDNGGLEALAQLADGRLFAISEALPAGEDASLRAAWLATLDGTRPRWSARAWRPAPDMDPTDAAGLPDGGALVLERSYALLMGFRCRLARVAPAGLASEGVLAGETLLSLPSDAPAENWEGVAVTRHRGRTLVALISDDNERRVQRSLLLLYLLA